MTTPGVLAINDNGGMFINFVLYECSNEVAWWILAYNVMHNEALMYVWSVDDMKIIE